MGNSNSINFDQKKTSTRAIFSRLFKCVVFNAQMTNNVAFFSLNSADHHVRFKPLEFDLKFKLDFGPQAVPVLGFFNKEQDIDDLWLQDNPEVTYWNMIKGKLIVKGKEESDQSFPFCKPGALVQVITNGKSTNHVNIQVTNPGESTLSYKLCVPGLTSDVAMSFVGAIQTGRQPVTFQLLPSNGLTRPLTTEDELEDVTDKAFFEESFGIINVSHDHKILSRTSSQQGNGYGLLNKIISKGIHRFKVSISCDFGASLCIGIARYPFRLSEEYVKDHLKHIYRHPGLLVWRSYRGILYIDGKQQEESTEALGWQHGDNVMIELIINMEERTVEILKNDRSLGIIFTDIPEVVQPVICFYAAYEKNVKLLSYKASKDSLVKPTPKPRSSLVRTLSKTSSTPVPSKVTFDHENKYGHISLSIDKMTVFREKNQSGNSFCMLNVTCDRNCYYRFSFVVENDQGASVCIGVTEAMDPKSVQTAGVGNIYASPSLYVFRSFQGMLYNKGKEMPKHFEEYWMTGTLIEMIVDINETEAIVQYSVNGAHQGTAFSGLHPPLKPLVAFYAGMEKRITLIHFEHKQKRVHVHSPSKAEADSPNTFSLKSLEPRQTTDTSVPVLLRRSSVVGYYGTCMTCGKQCDSIALPCKHAFMCAEHLHEHILRKESCFICGNQIDRPWNILSF